jgi:membrane-bound serine protease (ClpP class)
MDNYLLWGFALLGLALVLLAIDLFIPSGGILSMTAVVVAIAGVVCMWQVGELWGAGSTLAVVILGPVIGYYGIKLYRHTPMGRKLIGAPTEEEIERTRLAELDERKAVQALVGLEGVALTDLKPVGVIQLEGKRYDALSENFLIRKGARVRVVSADFTQIKVRAIS